jgi:CheY-like chemotaxis protein
VAEARELLRPLISTSIRMEIDDPPSDLVITGDITQLQQVLVNLVVNARDAMPAGGRLWLRTAARSVSAAEAPRLGLAAPGAYVEFSVEDTGVGMAEEVRARVFEPFFTTKAVGQGTGLGLATAYGIVQQCGGVITVDSEPGHGSVFRVLLPRTPEADAWAEPSPSQTPPPGSGTVLLAEDEANVRRLLARMLAEGGYEVIEAGDGADALRLGRQNLLQLAAVVTDIDMPLLGGVELVRRLVRQRPGLPVLFISGSTTGVPGAGDPDLPAERWSFLAKPFDEGSLLDSLHALMSAR